MVLKSSRPKTPWKAPNPGPGARNCPNPGRELTNMAQFQVQNSITWPNSDTEAPGPVEMAQKRPKITEFVDIRLTDEHLSFHAQVET